MQFDLVFEGGGAKGFVFVGAMRALEQAGHTPGRLLGTSAGAINAALVAAGYSSEEMRAATVERDEEGEPVFLTFMGEPEAKDAEALSRSHLRAILQDIDIPGVPEFIERYLDDWLVSFTQAPGIPRHVYSLIEEGGWFTARAFIIWMREKLNSGTFNGKPRAFGDLTLAQMYEETHCQLTVVASNTSSQSLMVLNHLTAPDMPVVWAVRASMSIPMVWPEVIWREEWGSYRGQDVVDHRLVDGGLLSNFPIELFVSRSPAVLEVMGDAMSEGGPLGFLIDESAEVPGEPEADEEAEEDKGFSLSRLQTAQRLSRLLDTMLVAHDKMVIDSVADRVIRLPAKGYGTMDFGLSGARLDRFIDGGHSVTEAFLETVDELLDGPLSFGGPDDDRADDMAAKMLGL